MAPRIDRGSDAILGDGFVVMRFRMRKPPQGADDPEDEVLHATYRACEGNAEAWRAAVAAYRAAMADLTEMPLKRVRLAGERLSKLETPALQACDSAIAKASSEAEELRRKLVLPKPGAHLATEIRQHFATLDKSSRVATAFAAMRSGDAMTAAALLEGPAYLSGLTVGEQAQVRDMVPSLLFAKENARIAALTHAEAEVARSAHELMALVIELLPPDLVAAGSDDETAHRRAAELCEQEHARRRPARVPPVLLAGKAKDKEAAVPEKPAPAAEPAETSAPAESEAGAT